MYCLEASILIYASVLNVNAYNACNFEMRSSRLYGSVYKYTNAVLKYYTSEVIRSVTLLWCA